MKLINLTPHPINLQGLNEIPSSGVARLKEEKRDYGKVGITPQGVEFASIRYGEVQGLPDNFVETGDIYIVSRSIAERVNLPCVVCPDKLLRDERGNIVGCEGVAWFPADTDYKGHPCYARGNFCPCRSCYNPHDCNPPDPRYSRKVYSDTFSCAYNYNNGCPQPKPKPVHSLNRQGRCTKCGSHPNKIPERNY